MATNLISTISQVLSPELLMRIASALGLDKYVVEKAVSAGVPALLAAFSSRASTREGAESLNGAIANQQPGVLTNLANLVGGAGQGALIDSGFNALTSLLGRTTTNELTNAVGKFSGIGGAGSKSMMGLLGPVVMGVLGQQQQSTGRSAAQLLASQKDNIDRALPRGFSEYLSGTDILGGITGANVEQRSANYAVDPAKQRAWERPASGSGWLLPALALAALGGLLWYFISGPTTTNTAETKFVPKTTAETKVVPKAAEEPIVTGALKSPTLDTTEAFQKLIGVKVGDLDLGVQLTKAVNGLQSSLEGIKDEATAQTAVPAITNSKDEFDRVVALISQLAPETRTSLAGAIAAVKPALDQMIDKAMAVPGVGSVIKPTVDTIRSKLDVLAAA